MFLKNYVKKDGVMNIQDFISLQKESVIRYDFLKQGDEPDRSELTKGVYREIFPWYEEDKHSGDTLNTYRTAIKKFYGNYYRFLDRNTQLEIIEIIKKYTNYDKDQIFEFEDTDKNGNSYFQICNNYQLGNFGILPIRNGINPKRSKYPYLDFFTDFINVLYNFYEEEDFVSDDELKEAILQQADYFNQFEDLNDYLDDNFLRDFLYLRDDGYYIIDLENSETFEDYVSTVTEIIVKRGRTIWSKLTGIDEEFSEKTDVNLPDETNEFDERLTEKLTNLSNQFETKYKVDTRTANKMAEFSEVEQFLRAKEELENEWNEKENDLEKERSKGVSKLNNESSNKIHEIENNQYPLKDFNFVSLWTWPIFFIGWRLVKGIIKLYYQSTYRREVYDIPPFLNAPISLDIYKGMQLLEPVFYLILFGTLIWSIYHRIRYKVYRMRWYKKKSIFKQQQIEMIEKIRDEYNKNIESSNEVYASKKEALDEFYKDKRDSFIAKHKKVVDLYDSIPESYQNHSDISTILSYIRDERADNFKEAYELIDNKHHRNRLEREAIRATTYAQQAADKQEQMAYTIKENAERQIEATKAAAEAQSQVTKAAAEAQVQVARDLNWETERHNREVEKRWRQ